MGVNRINISSDSGRNTQFHIRTRAIRSIRASEMIIVSTFIKHYRIVHHFNFRSEMLAHKTCMKFDVSANAFSI